MVVAMFRMTVNDGRGQDLEQAFARRMGLVDQAPGFVAFDLLRPVEGTEYVVMTRWQTVEDFRRWRESEAHARAHERPEMPGVFAGMPKLDLFQVVGS